MNSVIVFDALRKGYNSVNEIIDYAKSLGNSISKKTVLRQINTLCDLGYDVQKRENSWFIEGKIKTRGQYLVENIKPPALKPSAYPVLILHILEGCESFYLDQEDIISFLHVDYRCKLTRQAVSRSIEGLRKLGYHIEHTKEGYKLIR